MIETIRTERTVEQVGETLENAAADHGLRVLNVHDLGFGHKGGRMFMSYHRQLVDLASKGQRDSLTMLGIRSIR